MIVGDFIKSSVKFFRDPVFRKIVMCALHGHPRSYSKSHFPCEIPEKVDEFFCDCMVIAMKAEDKRKPVSLRRSWDAEDIKEHKQIWDSFLEESKTPSAKVSPAVIYSSRSNVA